MAYLLDRLIVENLSSNIRLCTLGFRKDLVEGKEYIQDSG